MSRFAAIQCDSPSANCTDEASDRWSRRLLRGQTDRPRAADEKPNQLNSTTLGWNRNSVRSAAAAASDAAKRKRFIVVGVGSEPSSASSVLFPSSSVRGGDCELNRRRSKNGIKMLRLDTACFT